MHFNNCQNIEKLIRDSERLAVVTDYVANAEYFCKEDLMMLLGIEPQKKEDK